MYKLIIEDDEGKTTVVPLIRDEITIGRKEGNTIRLTERNVSRRHARLVKSGSQVLIEDAESYNGIRVNGERIEGRHLIAEGDRIQIGDYQLALKLDKGAGASEPREERTAQLQREELKAPPASSPPPAAPPEPRRSPNSAHTQALQPAVEPPAAARPARLVVVSSNLAGVEFVLDQAQLVVGRTPDNDLVLDHHSVSRHHARIMVDPDGRFHAVDLGSANGLRVNGEEYSKVELRKGDMLDLGRVRLRFCAPNEDFVLGRDAQIVDLDNEGGRKSPVKIIVAALAGLAAVVAVALVVTHKSGKPDTAAAVAEVDQAMAAERWDEAIAKAQEGLSAAPDDSALREKKAKAEAEQENQRAYEAFKKAVKDNDFDAAVDKHQAIHGTSVYLAKSEDSWGLVKGAYMKIHLSKAKELQAGGNCDAAKDHIMKVLLLDDTNEQAVELAKSCGQPVVVAAPTSPKSANHDRPREADRHPTSAPVAAARPTVKEAAKPPKEENMAAMEDRPAPAPKPAPAPAPEADNVDTLVADSQSAYVHGNYQTAIEKARKALHSQPGNTKAWRIVGASSCFLHDASGASSAWKHLAPSDRQFLQYVCQRNNITVP